MRSKPITDVKPRERYAETAYGDGTDEVYMMVSIRPSTSQGYVRIGYIDEIGRAHV